MTFTSLPSGRMDLPRELPCIKRAVAHLVQMPIMAALHEEEAYELLSHLHPYTIPAGEVFILEDDPDNKDFLMLILEGDVVVESTLSEHQSLTVSVLGEGKWLGELSMLDGRARQAACRAADDGDVLCAILSRQDYLDLLRANPVLASKLTLVLAYNVTTFLRDVHQKMCRYAAIIQAHKATS